MKSQTKNFVEKIINCLLNVLIFVFSIILLISVYTGVQTKILGNDHTDFFGYSLFEVQTGSMADTINAGDWIIVQLTQKVKLNDIITYKLDKEYITHRVIEVYKGTYITKGDANNAKDKPIDQKQVVGKVVKVLANFGILRKTLFNPSVLIALIVTLLLFNFAFKNNKAEGKNKSSEHHQETKKSLLFDAAIEKIKLFINFITKKINLLIKNIKKLINNKKTSKTIANANISKIENQIKESDNDKQKEIAQKIEPEDYYKDEDELEKTSFYRVVPVDANEVDDKYKNTPTKAEVEEYYKDEDELEKTSLFRMIPVDATEVNNTLLEIANNEIKETEQKDNKDIKDTKNNVQEPKIDVESKKEETTELSADEETAKVNLELLKNKDGIKNGKNLINTAMLIKEEELNEVLDVLIDDDKKHLREAAIKDTFITTYINARYYNYYGDMNVDNSTKNTISKIESAIKEVAPTDEMIKDYQNNPAKYHDIVDSYSRYASAFVIIANLEHANDSIDDVKAKNQFYIKEIEKYYKDFDEDKAAYIVNKITEVQKKYMDMLKYFLKKLNTNMFDLNFNNLLTKDNMYGLKLDHNISFSKVYSDYIIDKTYTEGIIAEDKMSVLLTLLSIRLINDMIKSDFNNKYILYAPKTLYTKEKKFEKLLKIIDDKYAKDSVIILITFEDLLKNRNVVSEVRKMGYKFALVFSKGTEINETNRANICMADYIFIDKDAINVDKLLPLIPEELINNIIYENITDIIGDFGGEQE